VKKKSKKAPEPREQYMTPYLLYKDVGKALEWLAKAFGFTENGERFADAKGRISHAAMEISPGGEVFMLGSPGAKYKNPKNLGSVTAMMYITIDNVDKHFERARKSKAKILEKPNDTFYGDRRYGVTDPEGHQWYFAQHMRDMSAEEMQKAASER